MSDRSKPTKHQSPTLSVLEAERKPIGKTICEQCPHAIWHVTNHEVKAYCRVMYVVSWSTQDPNELKLCDGLFLQ